MLSGRTGSASCMLCPVRESIGQRTAERLSNAACRRMALLAYQACMPMQPFMGIAARYQQENAGFLTSGAGTTRFSGALALTHKAGRCSKKGSPRQANLLFGAVTAWQTIRKACISVRWQPCRRLTHGASAHLACREQLAKGPRLRWPDYAAACSTELHSRALMRTNTTKVCCGLGRGVALYGCAPVHGRVVRACLLL